MKSIGLPILASLLLSASMQAAVMPLPELPVAGSVVYAPHPHFRWKREADVKIDEVHRLQIARDQLFSDIVSDDRLEVVSRFVPVCPLEPGKYWWRVRRGEGDWSMTVPFEVREPEHNYTVPLGSKEEAVRHIMEEAAAHTPARVNFEAGEYAFTPQEGKSLITLKKVDDLLVDGNGARLVLGGSLLKLVDCRRVTIRNFTVTGKRPGHTLVRILRKENDQGSLVVKPEPGHDPDVPFYFQSGKNFGGSFLGCMDPDHPGREVTGALVSARWATVMPLPNEPGVFAFSRVPTATLDLFPVGATAIVTLYRWRWLEMVRGEECTLSHVTAVDLPGAFSGGGSSAKSYLSCRVQRRSPGDYYGGHSATGSGRIGEWIENCEFEYLPDDGPAEQSFRSVITATSGPDSVLIAGNSNDSAVQPGDRVSLVDLKVLRGASATVASVTQRGGSLVIQLDRTLSELAMRRATKTLFTGTTGISEGRGTVSNSTARGAGSPTAPLKTSTAMQSWQATSRSSQATEQAMYSSAATPLPGADGRRSARPRNPDWQAI